MKKGVQQAHNIECVTANKRWEKLSKSHWQVIIKYNRWQSACQDDSVMSNKNFVSRQTTMKFSFGIHCVYETSGFATKVLQDSCWFWRFCSCGCTCFWSKCICINWDDSVIVLRWYIIGKDLGFLEQEMIRKNFDTGLSKLTYWS